MTLEQLRQQIDQMDAEILKLFEKRLQVVHQVGALKVSQGQEQCMIRPAREATMMRQLIASAGGFLSKGAVHSIWRAVIAGSTQKEAPFALALLSGEEHHHVYWLGREYFGSDTPCHSHPQALPLLYEVATTPHRVGLLPITAQYNGRPWWVEILQLPLRPSVFAALPFVCPPPFPLPLTLALSLAPAEPSGKDCTLLLVVDGKTISRESIHHQLQKQGVQAEETARFEEGSGAKTTRYQLFTLQGHHLETSEALRHACEKLQALNSTETPIAFHILGHYAVF